MGAWAAEIFEGQGGKVIAVSDAYGAIYNAEGLDIKALRQHLKAGQTIDTFDGGKTLFLRISAELDHQNCFIGITNMLSNRHATPNIAL